ncbi:hypothetical protein IJ847_00125 [Candidatus Saccharibacteria bacterium]|nr:hypothetical protein [Candidatus Saccharibacteria bacterium]
MTGRCKKIEESTATECQAGYYRNPETGRCKKIATEKTTECADGYERNPDTNRCRKIRTSAEMDFAPTEVGSLITTYDDPKVFVGTGVLIVLSILSVIYTLLQFRREIAQIFRRIIYRIKIKTQKHGP